MTEPGFTVNNRRTASGLYVGNADAEMRRLRARGYTLPGSDVHARIEARKVVSDLRERGTVTDVQNRAAAAAMRQERFQRAASRMPGTTMSKTGANVQMVLPKVRQPLSSLMDKGIPFNTQDPAELVELRRWCRLFFSTHDLVPLLIDIYSKFPVQGIEFQCFASETEVITSEGVRPIGDLAGSSHRILTTGGKWTEAPFKSFGEQKLMKVVVQRNGRQRELFATPEHRWFVETRHRPRRGRNRSRWSPLTWDRVDEMRHLHGEGWRQVNTDRLEPGMRLVASFGRNLIHDTNPSPFGVARGMTFGDGTRNTSGGGCHVDLYGEKDANMLRYFAGCTQYRYHRDDRAVQAIQVTDLPRYFKQRPALTESTSYLYGWLAGYFAADGTVSKKGEAFLDSASRGDIEHAQAICQLLGIHTSDIYEIQRDSAPLPQGSDRGVHTMYRLRLANRSLTEAFFCIPAHRERFSAYADRDGLESWRVVSVEATDRIEEVYCAVVPETEAFTLAGNILTGNCKDQKIADFYEQMFMDELNYGEFLPNGLLREYFMVGEATSLAHFNEQLGIWSSEELLNPDMIRVSKSMFVDQERVQLLVKDMVESLRQAAGEESPSEKFERTHQYQQLVKHYPEIIKAAMADDGLDISDALVSRIVNKAAWWDLRGTPYLLRSFRTLLLEESLNAAQDAVCDRLYAPMVLATLGIENMGDGEPWIPDQGELEDLRDDLQSALAADFKLLVHNMGLQVTSVFGRESVPRFDQDYERVDNKLMQAWGIGSALIMGGTGAGGTYASSAINREVCEQLMKDAQNKVVGHMRKRMKVIAEAQEHYDFELKGGRRVPIYEEIVQTNEETGEEEIVRVPKLLIPDIKFSTLNLRDEATERSFVSQLKQMGVPISDRSLAINIPFEFDQELERQSQETVDKGMAQAESMHVLQELCDDRGYPYPEELAQFLEATLQLRQMLAQTDMVEAQSKSMDQQMAQASPAGMMGLLPGTTMQPLAGSGQTDPSQAGADPTQAGDPSQGANPAVLADPSQAGADAAGGQQVTATMHGPRMSPPGGPAEPDDGVVSIEVPRNRARPEQSDEMRKTQPRKVSNTSMPGRGAPEVPVVSVSKFTRGPSSYGHSRSVDARRVERAVRRRELQAAGGMPVAALVDDPEFYAVTHMQGFESQIRGDWPEIEAGGAEDSRRLLEEAVEQYEEITGVPVRW